MATQEEKGAKQPWRRPSLTYVGHVGAVLQGGGQLRVFGAAAEEVGAYGDDDAQSVPGIGSGQEAVDELVALVRVVAEGVELFELVHDQPRVPVAVLRGQPVLMGAHRVLARSEDAQRGWLWAGRVRGAEAGNEAGTQ